MVYAIGIMPENIIMKLKRNRNNDNDANVNILVKNNL